MKLSRFNRFDIKEYLKKNLSLYITFFMIVLIGLLFGVINSISSENYLKVLTKDDKILYSLINGSIKIGSVFGKYLLKLRV